MHRTFLLALWMMLGAASLAGATICGYVTDQDSGEPLLYAMVGVKGTGLGVTTNKKGYYMLNGVPTGELIVIFRKSGYRTETLSVSVSRPKDDLSYNMALKLQPKRLPDVIAEGNHHKLDVNPREIKVSTTTMGNEELKDVVSVGEADIFHSLMSLPGVVPISDFSSGLYVRGGSPDQNLILIDGIDVYNPSHFGGLFSTFNTDAVKDVDLIKGGFPAMYGGRLSSVLDVTNKDGNRMKYTGVAHLSPISASATLEGPWKIGNQSGSMMGSFRRTYFDLIKNLLDLGFDYYFYDGHAKVNWDLSPSDKLSVSTYFGKDVLGLNAGMDMDVSWGNTTFSTQWTHIFSPTLFSQFIVAGSHFNSKMHGKSDSGDYFDRLNDVYDFDLKSNLTWQPVEEHLVEYGCDIKFNRVNFNVKTNMDINEDTLPDLKVSSYNLSCYLQDSWNLGAFWTLQPGVRFTQDHSQSDYIEGKPTADYYRVDPRWTMRRKLTPYSNVYFSYGRYYQYLSQLSMGESSPLDLWFPIDKTVKPGQADHYILGWKSEIMGKFGLEVEGYYKYYQHLEEYRPETDYEWSNSCMLDDVVNMGHGFSYGADVLFRNDWHGFSGFIGYSYGITRRKTESMNIDPETGKERYYYPKYDRTHQVNITETYNYSEYTGKKFLQGEFSINMSYSFMTGQPTQKPEEVYFDGSDFQYFYSYADRERLPAYSRLDLSFNLKYRHAHYTIEPYLQLINALGQNNVWYRDYVTNIDPTTGDLSVQKKDTGQFPFLPLIGVNVEF